MKVKATVLLIEPFHVCKGVYLCDFLIAYCFCRRSRRRCRWAFVWLFHHVLWLMDVSIHFLLSARYNAHISIFNWERKCKTVAFNTMCKSMCLFHSFFWNHCFAYCLHRNSKKTLPITNVINRRKLCAHSLNLVWFGFNFLLLSLLINEQVFFFKYLTESRSNM